MVIDEKNIRIKTSRASGPGGQNVNKRSTRVQVWVKISDLDISDEQKIKVRGKLENNINEYDELFAENDEERSQERNKEKAIEKLNALLEDALREDEPRIPTEPHHGAIEERLHHKHLRYQKKKSRREGKSPDIENVL